MVRDGGRQTHVATKQNKKSIHGRYKKKSPRRVFAFKHRLEVGEEEN